MIILTEEQANERLTSTENLNVIVTEKKRGNHTGASRREVGDVKTLEEKSLMASIAVDNKLQGITIKETAAQFGIAPTTLGEYIHGKFTNNPGSDNSVRKPESKHALINEKAADKIVAALEAISDEKLDGSSASELASVASKLAGVTEKLTTHKSDGATIHVNIYAPKLLTENHFTTITD